MTKILYFLRTKFCKGTHILTRDGVAYYLHMGWFGGFEVISVELEK